jgi:uncharacterized protein
MPRLSRNAKRLAETLLDLEVEAMLIEELDGYIAGLIVCPELIPPSIWMPPIWNREGDVEPVFKDIEHAKNLMTLLMAHYNDVASTLFECPHQYAPIFAVDRRHKAVMWELWIEGFEAATALKPAAWQKIAAADQDTVKAWSGLMMLADVARRDPRFSPRQIDAISSLAHEYIAGWVKDLAAWRLDQDAPFRNFAEASGYARTPSGKVGRNEACPCGSGKKYKKCCGLN